MVLPRRRTPPRTGDRRHIRNRKGLRPARRRRSPASHPARKLYTQHWRPAWTYATADLRQATSRPCQASAEESDLRSMITPPPNAQPVVGRPSTDYSRWPLALVGERIGLLAQADPHRRTRKFEKLTQGVDEIAQVGLRHGVRARTEQDETRRPRLGLGDVIQFQPSARHRRRRFVVDGLLDPAIKRSRRHPPVPHRARLFDH